MPLDFKHDMTVYTCSKNSLKLQYYQKVPYLFMAPFAGLYGYYMFNFCFVEMKFFTLAKALLSGLPALFAMSVSKNLNTNAKCLAKTLHLLEDGMHLKIKKIDGSEVTHEISQLKPLERD